MGNKFKEGLPLEKQCAQCGKIKHTYNDYYQSNGRTRTICKDCVKENEKQRYAKRLKEFDEYKQTLSCKKCGENRYYLFEFHHRDPSKKDFAISDRTRTPSSQLIEEIEKCDVLCSNCHREWHYFLQHNINTDYENWLQS